MNVTFSPDRLYIIPLGGLGEIGKNMAVFLYGSDMIVVDAGVMFPKDDMLGIDLVISDISFILERQESLRGIFLTHGHEDHIGALPYILPKLNVPVYGTKLTLGFVRGKLKEFGLHNKVDFQELKSGQKVKFNEISVDCYSNVHSINDGVGIIIETPLGKVIHSGDFKFDQTPGYGMATDYKKLVDLGEEGVLALLSDSTYAERPGYSGSEKMLRSSFKQIFSQAPGRVILATFASSIPRIQNVIDIAEECGRQICFIGKSMIENVKTAVDLGYLHLPTDMSVAPSELKELSPEKIVILTTGSQGEPLSALALMASKSHRSVEIMPGDTVVISATPIPGNEGLVFRTINQLFRQGANVIYSVSTRQADGLPVHVQGHAGQEELKLFMNLVKPRFFVPIHGEYRHLICHGGLARDVGIPTENIVIAVDGDIIEVSADEIKVLERISLANVFVHGYGVGEIGKSIIKERRALGEDGLMVISVILQKDTLQLVEEPKLVTRGFISGNGESSAILEEATQIIVNFFGTIQESKNKDPEIIKGNLKGELNKFFIEKMGRKPIILPVFSWL